MTIVAATGDDVRRDLVRLAREAQLRVGAIAQDPPTLAALLGPARDVSVVTGGILRLARPFLSTARLAKASAVAILSGRLEAEDRSELGYGGLAVLRASTPIETFRAAIAASRAGLNVWDPDSGSLAEVAESIAIPLSPRERTVLELAGTGLPTKAIARQLGISPNTVKFHLQAAFEKLGAGSRAEAVMTAIRRGELSV
jgi:DNA-binding NarL/FixJ family response regulator